MESFRKCLSSIKKYSLNNKKKVIYTMLFFVILSILTVIANYNYFMYKDTIVKVTSVDNRFDHSVTTEKGTIEKYYIQNIKGIIKNGEYKGEEVEVKNEYSYSGVKNDKYSKGNDLFVKVKERENGLTLTITGVKRDKYVVFLAVIFILIMFIVAGKKGVLSVVSVAINIVLYSYALHLYANGKDILLACNILIILFSIISLILVSGFNKQTLIAIISTLVSMEVIHLLYSLVIKFGEQPEYMMMEYISRAENLEYIFMAGVLIGGLGAIMDVAISISVAVNELITKDKNITVKALILSIKEIGYDIMGTMINVLFFSYMCGIIPMFILKIKNNYQLISMLKFQIPFEIIRFLVGSIGIILTIPISGFVAILIMRRRGKKND